MVVISVRYGILKERVDQVPSSGKLMIIKLPVSKVNPILDLILLDRQLSGFVTTRTPITLLRFKLKFNQFKRLTGWKAELKSRKITAK